MVTGWSWGLNWGGVSFSQVEKLNNLCLLFGYFRYSRMLTELISQRSGHAYTIEAFMWRLSFFLTKGFPPPSIYWCLTAGAFSYFLSWVSHPYPASRLHMGLPNLPAQKFPASRLVFEGPHSEHSLAQPATSPPDIFWLSDRHRKPQRSTLTHRWWGPICTQLPLAACLSFPPSPISSRQAQTPASTVQRGPTWQYLIDPLQCGHPL